METTKKILVIAFQIILGICYVKFQVEFMNFYIKLFGDAMTGAQKVAAISVPLVVNLILLFGVNHLLFKTNNKVLGICAGTMAFIYFYIVHPQQSPLSVIIGVIMYWPSFINMLLMVGSPIVFGIVLNKALKGQPPAAGDAPSGAP